MDHAPRLSAAPRPGPLEGRGLAGPPRGAVAALTVAALTLATLLAAACAPSPSAAVEEERAVAWHALGSWSGSGSVQTESFLVEGSVVRVRWETRSPSPDAGTFRLTFHSAVSGRELAVAADQRGAGRGEFYIPEEPRPAYFIVESAELDWSFSVDEGVAGTVAAPPTDAGAR